MRVLMSAAAGLVIGASAGLGWFLFILLMPSNVPDNVDGGAGLSIVLFLIAGGFAIAGGTVGCVLGLVVGAMYQLARGIKQYIHDSRCDNLESDKKNPPFDELLG